MKQKKSKIAKFTLSGEGMKKFLALLQKGGIRDRGYSKFMGNLAKDTKRTTKRVNKFDVLDTYFKLVTPKEGVEHNFSSPIFCRGISPLAKRYINSKILKALGLKAKGGKELEGTKKYSTLVITK